MELNILTPYDVKKIKIELDEQCEKSKQNIIGKITKHYDQNKNKMFDTIKNNVIEHVTKNAFPQMYSNENQKYPADYNSMIDRCTSSDCNPFTGVGFNRDHGSIADHCKIGVSAFRQIKDRWEYWVRAVIDDTNQEYLRHRIVSNTIQKDNVGLASKLCEKYQKYDEYIDRYNAHIDAVKEFDKLKKEFESETGKQKFETAQMELEEQIKYFESESGLAEFETAKKKVVNLELELDEKKKKYLSKKEKFENKRKQYKQAIDKLNDMLYEKI